MRSVADRALTSSRRKLSQVGRVHIASVDAEEQASVGTSIIKMKEKAQHNFNFGNNLLKYSIRFKHTPFYLFLSCIHITQINLRKQVWYQILCVSIIVHL